jgi:hypothetical protein
MLSPFDGLRLFSTGLLCQNKAFRLEFSLIISLGSVRAMTRFVYAFDLWSLFSSAPEKWLPEAITSDVSNSSFRLANKSSYNNIMEHSLKKG